MRIAPLRDRTWRDEAARGHPARSRIRPLQALLYHGRAPVEAMLTASLRRIARGRPEAFERLGPVRETAILVAPTDLPVAFELRPDGVSGRVRVVRPDQPDPPTVARVSGPLLTLLALFDGRGDADGAFFQRRIRVEGDTAAVLALHNALEASELTSADILGLPGRFAPLLDAAMAMAQRLRGAEKEA